MSEETSAGFLIQHPDSSRSGKSVLAKWSTLKTRLLRLCPVGSWNIQEWRSYSFSRQSLQLPNYTYGELLFPLNRAKNISSQLMSQPPAIHLSNRACLSLLHNFLTDTRRWLLGCPISFPGLTSPISEPFLKEHILLPLVMVEASADLASVYQCLSCTGLCHTPVHGSLGTA